METIYDESLPVLERIKMPMVWERIAGDVRVEDLQPQRYNEAQRIIEEYFVKDDPLCKACKLQNEEEAVKEFLELTLLWIQDTQSFVAVEETTNQVVGVLVGRVNDKNSYTRTMSRTRIYQTKACSKIKRFASHVGKRLNIYDLYNTESFFNVYIWCVEPDHRCKGIGKALLRSAIEQTISFKISLITGMFTSGCSQRIASNMGFKTESENLYWQWKDTDGTALVNPGPGNSSANFMTKDLRKKSDDPEEKDV